MEIFKDFKEGYQISNLGNVKNPKGEVMNVKSDKTGYKTFKIKQKDYLVHRVVLEIFNPVKNIENKWVKRLDGNKLNNEVSNLYWVDKPLPVPKKEKSVRHYLPTEYVPLEDEVFLPVNNFESLYSISNYGNIINLETNLKLYKGFDHSNNQYSCNLYKNKSYKRVNVAKEMLKVFDPIENNKHYEIYYLDHDFKNINLKNLKWKIINDRNRVKSEKDFERIFTGINNFDLLEGEVFVDCYGVPNYEISNKGRLIHKYNRTIRKLKSVHDGYVSCNFKFNNKNIDYRIHRLVLMSFDPKENMENLYVNHINHIRDDNRLENLEWVTPKENNYHAKLTSNYRNTKTVGIKKNGRNRYSIHLNLGYAYSYEEAQKILFDACEKLNIDTKYFIRGED